MTTDNVIREFMNRNHSFYLNDLTQEHNFQMDKYRREGVKQAALITMEGCGVAEYEDKDCVKLVTFLSTDMLTERQIKEFQENLNYGNNRLKILQVAGLMEKEVEGNNLKFKKQ